MAKQPFDQVYDTIAKMVQNKAPIQDIDKALQDNGYSMDEYKALVRQARNATVATTSPGQQGAAVQPVPAGPLPMGVEAGLRGAVDTMTFGFGDEAAAAFRAGIETLKGKKFGPEYDKALDFQRGQMRAYRHAYPRTFVGGQIAGGLATAPLTSAGGASTLLGGAVRGGLEGAAGGAAYGAGSGETPGGRIMEAARGAGYGAAFGAPLGMAGAAIGQGARAAREQLPVALPGGNLTPDAGQALQSAGLDPNSVGLREGMGLAGRLQGRQSTAETIPATLRAMRAERAGVPLAAPQATQDMAALGRMQEGLAGASGPRAQRTAESFMAGQEQAFRQAAGAVEHGANPRAALGDAVTEATTGEGLARAIRDRADADRALVSRLYDAAGAGDHVIPARDSMGALRAAENAARSFEGVVPESVPAFRSALGTIRAQVAGQDVTLAHADGVRKRLGQLARDASTETDKAMVNKTIRAYDDWLDRTLDRQASTVPAESLARLKEARRVSKQWFDTYQPASDNPGDTVGRAIQDIRRGNLDSQKLFDKLMGGGTRFDAAAVPVARRVRNILGEDSPEWQQLRQGMVRRILFGDANKQAIDLAAGEQQWRTIDSNISRAIRGRGGPLAEMLGQDTVQQLLELRDVARSMAVNQRRAGNTSGTAFALMRRDNRFADNMARVAGVIGGGALGHTIAGTPGGIAGGALGGAAGGRLSQAAREFMLGREMQRLLRPYEPPPVPMAPGFLGPAGVPTWGAAGPAEGLLDQDPRLRRR